MGFVMLAPAEKAAAAVCPTTTNTNSDCGYIITIGPGGVLTGAAVPGANPYDGSDDALIGVINNSGGTYNSSFTLMGSGNGGGIFAFDGDGICTFVTCSYNNPTGYEGPLNTFANINGVGDTGDVVIAGLLDGSSTYFSLEGSPASFGGSIIVGGATPLPGALPLFASGLGALGVLGMKRKRKKAAATAAA